jgi:uncharacterized protein YifN (PemK superfamily)
MPLPFQPRPRTVVYCDFAGHIPPEMVKRRPVVVLATHKRNSKLVTVVPLSTTRPERMEEYHVSLLRNPLTNLSANEVWAKCDMVAVVSTERLELIPTDRYLPNGKRAHATTKIGHEQFDRIKRGVASALGLMSLLPSPAANADAPAGNSLPDTQSVDT